MTNLEQVQNDLNNYHRNKQALLIYYVNKRLNDSLKSYYSDLLTSVKFLNTKDDIKLIHGINKYE